MAPCGLVGGRGPVALGRSLAAAAAAGAGGAGMAPRPAPRRVLLTNDDGPASPFVHVFKAALRERLGWRTFTVLPDGEWSASRPVPSSIGEPLRKPLADSRRPSPIVAQATSRRA